MNLETAKNKNGYTLVEVIVAAGLFLFGLSIIVGVFTKSLRTQRMLNSLMQSQSNTSIMFEQMMREIRTGFNFSASAVSGSLCDNRGLSDKLTFSRFIGNASTTVSYEWDGINKLAKRSQGASPSISTYVMNDDTVLINPLCFNLSQNDANAPWRVNIFATVIPLDDRISNKILNIQTTISSRVLPEEIK